MRTLPKDYYRELERLELGPLMAAYVLVIALAQSRRQIWQLCDLFPDDCQVLLSDRKVLQDIWSSLNDGRQFHRPASLDSARAQWLLHLLLPISYEPEWQGALNLRDWGYYGERLLSRLESLSDDVESEDIFSPPNFHRVMEWGNTRHSVDLYLQGSHYLVVLNVCTRDMTRQVVDEMLSLSSAADVNGVQVRSLPDSDEAVAICVPTGKLAEEPVVVQAETYDERELHVSWTFLQALEQALRDAGLLQVRFI